jgi:hypothetical protein
MNRFAMNGILFKTASNSFNIDVLEMDMKNITLKSIGNKLVDFMIFSLSLWGIE